MRGTTHKLHIRPHLRNLTNLDHNKFVDLRISLFIVPHRIFVFVFVFLVSSGVGVGGSIRFFCLSSKSVLYQRRTRSISPSALFFGMVGWVGGWMGVCFEEFEGILITQ